MVMKRDGNQTAEYKESRPDKHLEWICGSANAEGGASHICERWYTVPVKARGSKS